MITYRDNMTADELKELMAEVDQLDAAYASAFAQQQPTPEGWEDEMELLHKAALNKGQP